METLGSMIFAADYEIKRGRDGGVAPIDFGGSNGSHHGATATKLVRLGLAEHKKRGLDWGQAPTRWRGSKLYRPTEAGRKAFNLWRDERKAQ